jgi:hypothetical protein
MRNEFTAIVERDGPWFVSYCAEIPGANGHGEARDESIANLREAGHRTSCSLTPPLPPAAPPQNLRFRRPRSVILVSKRLLLDALGKEDLH